jgi:hypothetical protein
MEGIGAVAFGAVLGWWALLVGRWPTAVMVVVGVATPVLLLGPVGGLAAVGAVVGALAHAGFLVHAGHALARREARGPR